MLPATRRLPSSQLWRLLDPRLHRRSIHQQPSDRLKILFFGRDQFSVSVFGELYAAKDLWDNITIVTQPDQWVGRRKSLLSVSPLKEFGEHLGVPVCTLPEVKKDLKTWRPPLPFHPLLDGSTPHSHHVLVTASFGRILPKSLLRLFKPSRRLNVHPSLLPAYRGPAPIQHAILNDEKETGVCIIEMKEWKEGIDTGDVYGRVTVPIPPGIPFADLRDLLAKKGGALLVSTLRNFLSSSQPPVGVPQSTLLPIHPPAPYITASDALVTFKNTSAEEIVRRHRAIAHHKPLTALLEPGPAVQLHDPNVFVGDNVDNDATFLPHPGSSAYHKASRAVLVRCAGGSVLSVQRLKTQNRGLVYARDWWHGMSKAMGGPVNFA
ncbi:Formyltransferase [Artomyces pyxidatus]|uniref:Formyltransferase n=1 Tax=Artomyces pyxidatus TaxID=48021 RepID=A0ACB8SKA7_9AGAM|nr:Formyltransferase [Artomyces pyxidatus]